MKHSTRLPLLGKPQMDNKKYRIKDHVLHLKEAVNKRKFNQAYEYAVKEYEQNKTSLNNEHIYTLSWFAFLSMHKKMETRLVAPQGDSRHQVTNSEAEQLFGLHMSLHCILLPEFVHQDKPYFNMLPHSSQVCYPSELQKHFAFERKQEVQQLPKKYLRRELKKIVKQYLRMCVNTLIFKTKIPSRNTLHVIKTVQSIFDGFEQHDFTCEFLDFEIAKLTLLDALKIHNHNICKYALPIGLLAKIYKKMRKGSDQEILQHYVKKLYRYLVLCLKNVPMTVEDIYTLCKQVEFLVSCIMSKTEEQATSRNLPMLVKNVSGLGGLEQRDDQIIKSPSKNSPEKGLRYYLNLLTKATKKAMQKINIYLQNYAEAVQIVLHFFTRSEIERKGFGAQEQVADQPVIIDRINRRFSLDQAVKMSSNALSTKKREKSLIRLVTKLSKKGSIADQNDSPQTKKLNFSLHNNSKFIVRNKTEVSRKTKLGPDKASIQRAMNRIKTFDQFYPMDQSSSDSDGQQHHYFEKLRRQKIADFNIKHGLVKQYSECESENVSVKLDDSFQQLFEEKEHSTNVKLMDEAIKETIQNECGLTDRNGHKNQKLKDKLQSIRNKAIQLNRERKEVVETLNRRYDHLNELKALDLNQSHLKIIRPQKHPQQLKINKKQQLNLVTKKKPLTLDVGQKSDVKPRSKKKRSEKQLTLEQLQQTYNELMGINSHEERKECILECGQFDNLRRDVAKHQFELQALKKKGSKKNLCQTIIQVSQEGDATALFDIV